jgi:hypothetical protein
MSRDDTTAQAYVLGGLVTVAVLSATLYATYCATEQSRRKHEMKIRATRTRAQRDAKLQDIVGAMEMVDSDSDADANLRLNIFATSSQIHKACKESPNAPREYSKFLARLIIRCRTVGRDMLNAVTEELYDDAMAEIEQCIKDAPKNSPLAGIPVSIKDSFEQKGCDSTCGAAARCLTPCADDGLIVKLLRRAGMVPFVRTNIPQLLLLPESENNIWGQAKNPWDLSRTPGACILHLMKASRM